MEPGVGRRLLAGLVDVGVPLVGYALMWPVALVVVPSLSLGLYLGLYAVLLFPVLLLIGWGSGVIINEFAFPKARGWTVGMLFTRLRVVRTSVRTGGLLLRSLLTWVSIPAMYIGAEFVRWELLVAMGVRPRLYSWLFPPSPVATAVVLAWALVLTYPFGGRPVLDRVAGWQIIHRDALPVAPEPEQEPEARKRAGQSLWVWVLVTLAGVVAVVVLAFGALVVAISIQDPGPVARVESDLRNAASALEVYHHERGHYAEEALETSLWGYRRDPEVQLEVHISPDAQSFCLEGFHFDSTARISTYDSVDGLDREATC